MSVQETLLQLEAKQENLKLSFQHEALFNEEILQDRKDSAKQRINTKQEFKFMYGLNELVPKILELYAQGWTFEPDVHLNRINTWTPADTGIPIVQIHMTKPASIQEAELAELEAEVEAEYRKGVDESRVRLSRDLATATIEISECKQNIRDAVKRQKAIDKEIDRIEAELLGVSGASSVEEVLEPVTDVEDQSEFVGVQG